MAEGEKKNLLFLQYSPLSNALRAQSHSEHVAFSPLKGELQNFYNSG